MARFNFKQFGKGKARGLTPADLEQVDLHPHELAEIPTSAQINAEHQLAQNKVREAVQHAVNCGAMLLAVKASLDHGEWLPWLSSEIESGRLSFKVREAQNYMKLATNAQRVAYLDVPSIRKALEFLSDEQASKEPKFTGIDAETDSLPVAPLASALSAVEVVGMLAALPPDDKRMIINTMAADAGLKLVANSARYVHVSEGRNDWYTPREYIDAARKVMGGIDLDPASADIANQTVQAKAYFTQETDGLKQEWAGRVWLNPPYSMPLIQQFAEKLVAEFSAGKVAQAVVIVNSATETGWFCTLLRAAGIFCLLASRTRFWSPIYNDSQPRQGQTIFYFGNNRAQFIDVFTPFGEIVFAMPKNSSMKGADFNT